MLTSRLFEVWNLSVRPPSLAARFRFYEDAAGYIARQDPHNQYDIRYPDGSWSGERVRAPQPAEVRAMLEETLDDSEGDIGATGAAQ